VDNQKKIIPPYHKYNDKYYNRHFVQYRDWENAIGKHIFETIKPSSILDLGCGVGSYLEGALNAGCQRIYGIEISFEKAKKYITKDILPYITYGDITENLILNYKFDCVISFEVAEHISPHKTTSFIKNLIKYSNKYIIITAACPGQRGTGHINLREKEFWIKLIESYTFKYKEKLVEKFTKDWKSFSPPKYILQNLMVFKK
jgi:2-polyprenyl-3-methyl-5-hydroxy-6-metoxy-1,4-benzoquinol methylase